MLYNILLDQFHLKSHFVLQVKGVAFKQAVSEQILLFYLFYTIERLAKEPDLSLTINQDIWLFSSQ